MLEWGPGAGVGAHVGIFASDAENGRHNRKAMFPCIYFVSDYSSPSKSSLKQDELKFSYFTPLHSETILAVKRKTLSPEEDQTLF